MYLTIKIHKVFAKVPLLDFYKKKLLIAIVLLTTVSCTNRQNIQHDSEIKPYPHTINIEEGLNNKVQFRLSDIADSIMYVVLSRDKEVLIEDVFRLKMEENDFYFASGYTFMHFNISGKFLNSFGREGRGPEEYIRGSLLTTTPTNDCVLILRSMMYDYMIFTPDGKYLETRKIPHPRNLIGFTNVADSVFLITFWYQGAFMKEDIFKSMNWIAGIFNQDGTPIKVLEHALKDAKFSPSDLKQLITPPPAHTFFENRIVLSIESDTVYEIDKNSIAPGFIFQWGSVPHPRTLEERFIPVKRPNNLMSHHTLYETSRNAFLRIGRSKESYIIGYDKVKGETRSMSLDSYNGFINDLDGGADFYPNWTNRTGDIWIISDDAINFRKKNSSEVMEGRDARYPPKKEALRKLAEELNDDDNPVLTLVYLKK